ncbi:MAG TPA: hypothetical protein VJ725_26765 [Thermoanaerobaculia bacterium]|nr:hypothetical protein [Thermoanaerobaculia bacterium]
MVLGFGVGIGVGLAPFLGKLPVPGFDALLTVFPESLRPSLIPLSAFLMGLVATGVQFLYGERPRRTYLQAGFIVAFTAVLVGFFWLLMGYDELVVRIDIPAERTARTFVIAPERRPQPTCPCPEAWSDEECIRETLDPGRIERCWGSPALRRSRKVLRTSYLLLTGGFGATIGLLLLQERPARPARSSRKRKRSTT